jgi:hypothetical protein
MRMLKITITLAAIGPLALSACTTAGTSGTVGAGEPSGYSTSVPTANGGTATDAQQSGSADAPGHRGDVFIDSPEPGFNPDSIIEAP